MNRRDRELAEHHPWLRRLARRFTGSSARADDLVQDTCLTALRNAPADAQMRPWLRAVMRKLAWGQRRSERRRAQREQGFSLIAALLRGSDAHDLAVDRERLTAALASLPEPFHSTIVRRFFEGRSCADIARSDRVPAGTVRWRQARGLEMLRDELGVRPRHRMIWVLPFVGASGQLLVRAWQSLPGRRTGQLLWLWLACAVILSAIRGPDPADRRPDREDVARPRDGDLDISAGRPGSHIASPAATERTALAAASAQPSDGAAALLAAATPGGARGPRDALPRRDDVRESRDDDCHWDPATGWRCAEPPPSSTPPSDALCALVAQPMLTGDAIALASPAARGFLTAAMLANRALARQLGCSPAPPGRIADPGRRGGGNACRTRTHPDGITCTSCPGAPAVCAPAECHSRARPDGVVCTTCIDARGEARTDCPDDPPAACHSALAESGLLCTSCDGAAPECLPAECAVIDRCLRCVDPRGHIGIDCSADYEVVRSGSYTTAAENVYFSSCRFNWGIAPVSGTTCHYPGPQSCTVSRPGSVHCLACQFPDGAGMQLCRDTSEPLPDPLVDRPLDLPAPGTCTTELTDDGTVACATCTRDDLTATISCRYAGIESCDMSPTDIDPECVGQCRHVDGSRIRLCNSARGPRPDVRATP
jgi:RNA polymerase sigma-70 factor (ECF subfamily)